MPYSSPVYKHSLVILPALFLLAGLADYLTRYEDTAGFVNILFLISIWVYWAILNSGRMFQGNIVKSLNSIAFLCVVWMCLRYIRYRIAKPFPVFLRYLWYAYYIPQTLIVLQLLKVAVMIGKEEDQRTELLQRFLTIPAVIIILLVMTNELHEMAFRFTGDRADEKYVHGPVYYLAIVWIACGLLTALIILARKSILYQRKRFLLIPLAFVLVLAPYSVLYNLVLRKHELYAAYEFPEIFCFIVTLFIESCIRIGLIPCSTEFDTLFEALGAGAMIADASGRSIYESSRFLRLPEEVLSAAEKEAVITENGLRLCSAELFPGRIYWEEDLSEIMRMNDELGQKKIELEGWNDLIAEEIILREKELRIETEKQIYDRIERAAAVRNAKIGRLLKGLKPDAPDIKERIAEACIYNSYIKRRSNLEILSEDRKELDAEDLLFCIRESLEYFTEAGTPGTVRKSGSGSFPADGVTALYELFQDTAEALFRDAQQMMVRLSVKQGMLEMRILFDIPGDAEPSFQLKEAADGKIKPRWEREEDTLILIAVLGGEEL